MAKTMFDMDTVTQLTVATIQEAAAELGEPVGFILIVGRPGELENSQYATNLATPGAIETLDGMLAMLKRGWLTPDSGGLPN